MALTFTAARYPHRCAYQHRCAYSALPHHISKEKAHRSYYSDELLILFSTRCFSSPIRFVFQPSTFQKKQKRAHSTAVEKENRSGNKEKQELSLLGGHTLPYRRANSLLIRSYSTTPPSIKNIEEKRKESGMENE